MVSFTDGDGIRYSLRALPLGGYVSFPEGGAAAVEGDNAGAAEEDGSTASASARSGSRGRRRSKDEDAEEEEEVSEDDPDLLQNRPAIQVRGERRRSDGEIDAGASGPPEGAMVRNHYDPAHVHLL